MLDAFKLPKLKGSLNYDIQSIRITALIIEKGYSNYIARDLAVIYNNIEQLEEDALKTTALIKLALEDGPLLQTRFINNPYTLQITLENLYKAKGFSSKFVLSKELINTTLNLYKGNLEEYINAFKRVVNNLESRDILLLKKFITALLLNNLNKDYKYVVTIITQSIRTTNSEINLEEIISQLLDESRRLKSVRKSFNYNNYNSNYSNKNNNSSSNKNSNYSRDVKMSLNTSSKKKNNNNNNNNTSKSSKNKDLKCNYCSFKGHKESTCYKKYPNLRDNNRKSINNTIINKEEQVLATSINSSIISKKSNTIDFILDSSATIHTCSIKEIFNSIKPTNISIKWGNTNKTIKAEGIGSINLIFSSTRQLVKLTNVLFVPSLGVNLLSLSLITSKGYSLSFNKDNCSIFTSNNTLLAKGSYKKGVSCFSTISTKKPLYNSKTLTILNTIEGENNIIIEDSINLDNLEESNNNNPSSSSSNSSKKEEIVLNKNTIELAHKRLGHINLNAIKKLLSSTKVDFIDLKDIDTASISLKDCIPCIQSKLTKNINKEASTKVTGYLDLIYIDIGGPIRPKTFRGFKYYITFRDAYTKYLVVKLLKSRESIINIIKSTITELELEAINNSYSSIPSIESSIIEIEEEEIEVNNFSKPSIEPSIIEEEEGEVNNFNNNKVKALQLDNEFKSKELDLYLSSKGIKTRYSAPYTPEQNGAAEIINRVLLNKVRALLITSNLPKYLWGEAILTATYLYNRTPNSSIDFKTPYYLKYKKLPNINNIRIFGSLAYYKEPTSLIKKLDPRATPYYLVGFISNNIYKLYNPTSNKIVNSRDCVIIEGYTYKPNNNNNIQEVFSKLDALTPNNSNNNNNNIVIKGVESNSNSNNSTINPKVNWDNIDEYSEDELANNTSIIIEDKANSNSLEEIILNTIISNNNRQDWKSLYNKSILENILTTSNKEELVDPKTYKEVLLRKDKDLYLNAMQIEIEDLIKSNTWSILPKPNRAPIIKGRWVLNKKYNLDNTIKKYKARWVAKGFLQKYNINYKETFASTSKPSLIRLLLSIFAYLDWEIYTWDIKQAFPNADIDIDNIYIQLPIGLEDYILNKALENIVDKDFISFVKTTIKNKDYSNIVCKLNKALYGLKQASRQWQLFLTRILETIGFKPLKIDNSIFIHTIKPIILATHVDDILVFAKDITLVNNLYKELATSSKLDITNLGEIKEFLGVEIIRDRSKKSIIITQRSFISKILTKFNKLNNKIKSIPLPIGLKLNKYLEESSIIKDFQKEIGSLIYLTIFTRPDLVYSVNYLARFMSNPSLEHYKYLNYIFSYLLKTRNKGLDLSISNKQSAIDSINLIGISDADWGGDLDSRKSTIGNLFVLNNINNNNIAISWISKLQKTVALSSAEAEYMSLKEATKESLYLQNIIKELFLENNTYNYKGLFNSLNTIKTDSLSAIELAKNPVYHARTKHVDITYHFVRENLIANNINLVYENTSTILADNLTKSTSPPKFLDFITRINLVDL